jgi:hypothetical protein
MKYPWARVNLKTLVKKRQKRFNKIVRMMNKNIAKDKLWKGRFFARQLGRRVESYEDGSGATIRFKIGLYDKKTKLYAYGFIDDYNVRMFTNYAINSMMNKFIVDTLDVWHNENPCADEINYNEIKLNKDEYTLVCENSIFH